jgi:hypothetical protein
MLKGFESLPRHKNKRHKFILVSFVLYIQGQDLPAGRQELIRLERKSLPPCARHSFSEGGAHKIKALPFIKITICLFLKIMI